MTDDRRPLGIETDVDEERYPPDEGSGYSLPIALFAIVFIIGALIMFAPTSSDSDKKKECDRYSSAIALVKSARETVNPDFAAKLQKHLEDTRSLKPGLSCP